MYKEKFGMMKFPLILGLIIGVIFTLVIGADALLTWGEYIVILLISSIAVSSLVNVIKNHDMMGGIVDYMVDPMITAIRGTFYAFGGYTFGPLAIIQLTWSIIKLTVLFCIFGLVWIVAAIDFPGTLAYCLVRFILEKKNGGTSEVETIWDKLTIVYGIVFWVILIGILSL